MRRKSPTDYLLLAAILILLLGGLVMVYSASSNLAEKRHLGSWFFFKRQLLFAAVGLGFTWRFSRRDYNRLKAWVWPAFVLTTLGLVAVFFAPSRENVHRWLPLAGFTLQPSEFAKYTVVLFLAYYMDRNHSKAATPVRGLVVPGAVVSFLLFLISQEPDLGTPLLIFAVAALLIWVGGGKLVHLLGAGACAVPVVCIEIVRHPYRLQRIMDYLPSVMHPGSPAPAQTSYQVSQALLAIGSGGWMGKGLGASWLKLSYLPTPHTDFIFPVICEELGLVGAIALLGLFATVLVRGMRVARTAPDLFGALLAAGITMTICLQAFINACMSTGLLPTKGMPMPFISYGGSSLVVTLAAAGVLLSVSRRSSSHESYLAHGPPAISKDGPFAGAMMPPGPRP